MQGSARKHIETIAREKLPVAGPSVGALSSPLGLSFLLECNSFRGRVVRGWAKPILGREEVFQKLRT